MSLHNAVVFNNLLTYHRNTIMNNARNIIYTLLRGVLLIYVDKIKVVLILSDIITI